MLPVRKRLEHHRIDQQLWVVASALTSAPNRGRRPMFIRYPPSSPLAAPFKKSSRFLSSPPAHSPRRRSRRHKLAHALPVLYFRVGRPYAGLPIGHKRAPLRLSPRWLVSRRGIGQLVSGHGEQGAGQPGHQHGSADAGREVVERGEVAPPRGQRNTAHAADAARLVGAGGGGQLKLKLQIN